jgi:ketosteroid isomerase-like protein
MTPSRMTADDRLDIFDLFARYAWAYDCSDADAYSETFAPDGVLADADQMRVVGRIAIRRAIRKFFEMRGTSLWQHHNDHLRIEGNSQECTVWSYWAVLEHRQIDDYHGVGKLGYYFSRCVKLDGRWYLKERTFFVTMGDGLPWKNPALLKATGPLAKACGG